MNKAGKSKILLLDGTNYQFWKARIRIFIKSIDERAWLSVLNGWTEPTVTTDGVTTVKPTETWSEDDFKKAKWNSEALNAIQGHVTEDQFKLISTCETAQDAWNTFAVIHE